LSADRDFDSGDVHLLVKAACSEETNVESHAVAVTRSNTFDAVEDLEVLVGKQR
jgi:hypothetical protein